MKVYLLTEGYYDRAIAVYENLEDAQQGLPGWKEHQTYPGEWANLSNDQTIYTFDTIAGGSSTVVLDKI